MPGHMNVLLAEADISYDKLKEMDEINPIMDSVDVAIVIKRSLSPGFAGIQNPLFALPNTLMYFADGQAAVMEIVKAIK
jgi:H+-translocating NAD(P) transhydrogenase subunit beta